MYNEMGPGAGVVARRAVTREGVVSYIADSIDIGITTWKASRLAGSFNQGLQTSRWLAALVADNQLATLDQLEAAILKALVSGVLPATFKNGAASNEVAAFGAALVAKTVGTLCLWAVGEKVRGNMNIGAIQVLHHAVVTQMLDTINSQSGDKWLGIDHVGAASTSLTEARSGLSTDLMAVAGVAGSPTAKATITHLVDSIMHMNADSREVPGGVVSATALGRAPNAATLNRALDSFVLNTSGTNRHTADLTNVLHYLDRAVGHEGSEKNLESDSVNRLDKSQVKQVDIGGNAAALAANGRNRFDTILMRNLIFVLNLYRSVRMKLQRDLTYSKDIISRSVPVTRPQLTEFYSNQVYTGRDKYDSNFRYTNDKFDNNK
jgi:hypothetical protein